MTKFVFTKHPISITVVVKWASCRRRTPYPAVGSTTGVGSSSWRSWGGNKSSPAASDNKTFYNVTKATTCRCRRRESRCGRGSRPFGFGLAAVCLKWAQPLTCGNNVRIACPMCNKVNNCLLPQRQLRYFVPKRCLEQVRLALSQAIAVFFYNWISQSKANINITGEPTAKEKKAEKKPPKNCTDKKPPKT